MIVYKAYKKQSVVGSKNTLPTLQFIGGQQNPVTHRQFIGGQQKPVTHPTLNLIYNCVQETDYK
jgi:hypothetical protein